jgi:hypothetical protein
VYSTKLPADGIPGYGRTTIPQLPPGHPLHWRIPPEVYAVSLCISILLFVVTAILQTTLGNVVYLLLLLELLLFLCGSIPLLLGVFDGSLHDHMSGMRGTGTLSLVQHYNPRSHGAFSTIVKEPDPLVRMKPGTDRDIAMASRAGGHGYDYHGLVHSPSRESAGYYSARGPSHYHESLSRSDPSRESPGQYGDGRYGGYG